MLIYKYAFVDSEQVLSNSLYEYSKCSFVYGKQKLSKVSDALFGCTVLFNIKYF